MQREKHGSYCVSIVERVHCLSVIGAWNFEGMKAYLEEFKQVVNPLIVDGVPWASLVDLRQWGLSTPESIAPFNEAAKWASINNRSHIAIIADKNSVLNWLVGQFLQDTFVEYQFFSSRLAGWEWLKNLGYCGAIPLLVHRDNDNWSQS